MFNYSKDIDFFKKHGYLRISSLVEERLSESFKEAFFSIFKDYSSSTLVNNFNSEDFVDKFKLFRKQNERKLNGLFRSITKIHAFKYLFSNNKVLELISEIFGTPASTIILSEYQFRIDEPNDNLFTLDWHQDGTYYEQDNDGKSGLVINVCIQDCTADMGSPELILGSHKHGRYNSKKYLKPISNTLQHNTETKYVEEEKIVVLEPKVGDVVLYDMNLIHKSGYNISNKARFSAIARAFNPLSKNFIPFYFTEKKLLKT